jgi:hypothetical protein
MEQYAKEKGMPEEAATALRNQQVGVLYSAQARTLLGLGDTQGALRVINAHEKELGDDAIELRSKVELKARLARADEGARKLAEKYAFPDGTVDSTKAQKEIDATIPAGDERKAYTEALMHRTEEAKKGREAFEASTWDGLLNDYHQNSRSYWLTQERSKFWTQATPDQQEKLYQRWKADRDAAKNEPLTREQIRALGRLENDIMDRPDFWGTAENSVLDQNSDFNKLPERYRVHLTSMVAQTHQDKQNPIAQLKSAEYAIRARAQTNGILNQKKTAGKPFEKWEEEDQQAWSEVQDRVGPLIASWHADKDNRGKRIPNAVVEGFVDQVTRTGTVKNGRWMWFDKGGVPEREALARPAGVQGLHPFTPDVHDDEATIGREVQRRRGYDDAVTPGAFTPQMLIDAARDARNASAGPGPQEREAIVKSLRAAGAKNPQDPGLIQSAYEKRHLRYVR